MAHRSWPGKNVSIKMVIPIRKESQLRALRQEQALSVPAP